MKGGLSLGKEEVRASLCVFCGISMELSALGAGQIFPWMVGVKCSNRYLFGLQFIIKAIFKITC
jgi:hypothetical protein